MGKGRSLFITEVYCHYRGELQFLQKWDQFFLNVSFCSAQMSGRLHTQLSPRGKEEGVTLWTSFHTFHDHSIWILESKEKEKGSGKLGEMRRGWCGGFVPREKRWGCVKIKYHLSAGILSSYKGRLDGNLSTRTWWLQLSSILLFTKSQESKPHAEIIAIFLNN